jgi:hypothetical protein
MGTQHHRPRQTHTRTKGGTTRGSVETPVGWPFLFGRAGFTQLGRGLKRVAHLANDTDAI